MNIDVIEASEAMATVGPCFDQESWGGRPLAWLRVPRRHEEWENRSKETVNEQNN